MLLELFKEYELEGNPVSLPAFKAFVLSKYPKEYSNFVEKQMLKDEEYKKVLVLLEGSIVTNDLRGDLNTKAVERVLKKYHGYSPEESQEAPKAQEIKISIDPRSSNNG